MAEGYKAADGGWIALPEIFLPDGPEPDWESLDLDWVGPAFRHFWTDALSRATTQDQRLFISQRRDRAFGLVGDTGAGLARALGAADTPDAFWNAIDGIFAFWGPRIDRLAPAWQDKVVALLEICPPHRRVPIMAARLWPRTTHMKRESLYTPVAAYFEAPYADLRTWEVGMPKIAAEADLSPALWAEIEMAHNALAGSLGPFKAASLGNPKRGLEALSRSERNLMSTQAFLKVMRRHRMGIPGGHLMDLALSEKPPGHAYWPGIRWSDFRPEVVWPYIATHLDILERALGLRPQLSWSPVLSPLKALTALALLPALPASVVPGVEAVLRSGTKAQKKAAAALL